MVQAFYLVERGFQPVILEKEKRLNGLLGTHRVGSFLVEQGANAFLASRELERISQAIGVSLVPVEEKARQRFIYRRGKKCRQPLSFMELIPVLVCFLKGGLKRAMKNRKQGETLRQWGERCLGKKATDFFLEPAMAGIFAVTSNRLDADLVLSSLLESSPLGKWKGSVAPLGGLGQWLGKMKLYLESMGCEFVLNHNEMIDTTKPTVWAVNLASLQKLYSERVFQLPSEITKTKTASLSTVTLMFENQNLNKQGFGCLFPRTQDFHCLGVLFNHNIFKGRVPKGSSETWILNDEKMDFSAMSHSALLRYILSDRYQLTGAWTIPDFTKVFQWPDSIPVYDKNLKEFIKALDSQKRKDLFIGNYLGRLGLSGILTRARANGEKIKEGYFG